jgi:hypothetical protein
MKLHLPRSAPVVLVAAGCLLLGSTGGAVAGAMITGKQIKDNTVTTKDIKNGSLAVKDLSKSTRKVLAGTPGPAGATGARGPAGANGANGANGPRGFSAWDTMPSGVTVTGRFYDLSRSGATATAVIHNVNFPAKAPAAPTGLGFGNDAFAQTTTDPACTGTYTAPTAPPGHVCVYLDGFSGLSSPSVNTWNEPAQRPYTFYLQFSQSAANTSYSYWGVWAYTAP